MLKTSYPLIAYLTNTPYSEMSRYVVYVVGKDNQGITYTAKCVIYLIFRGCTTQSTVNRNGAISRLIANFNGKSPRLSLLAKASGFQ